MVGNEENIPPEFEKRVNRDKKIIYVATGVVALLIILFIFAIPSIVNIDDSYTDDYSSYDLNRYEDTSSSSNIKVKVTNVSRDSEGWYSVYGKITPTSINTTNFSSFVTYYDKSGFEIKTDLFVLSDNDHLNLLGYELCNEDVGSVDVNIVDNKDNIVAKAKYYL